MCKWPPYLSSMYGNMEQIIHLLLRFRSNLGTKSKCIFTKMPPRYPPPKKGQLPRGFSMPKLPDLVPVVLTAPSGGGKTTLMNRLVDEFPQLIAHSVSHTTRDARPDEVDGKDYNFVDDDQMQVIIKSGQFLEFMMFAGNIYGTTKSTVDDILSSGKICLLTLDINGCDVVRKMYKGAKLVFLMPPSKKDLETRILSRRGESTSEDMKQRLDRAELEIEYAKQPGKFDLILLNDDLDKCYLQLVQFLGDLLKLAKDKQAQARIKERVGVVKEKRIEQAKRRHSPALDNSDFSTGILTSSHLH